MTIRTQKQQSAVELLTTYAWAILIVAVFVAAVAVLATTRPPAAYLASSCNIQPLLPCTQTLLTTNAISNQRFVVQFTNNLGVPMQFAANAINLTTTNIGNPGVSHFLGNCTPSFATKGAQVLCTVYITGNLRPSPGTQTSTSFTLTYTLCNGNQPSTCQTTNYKSTGSSSQNAAPSNANFYTVNIVTIPTTGSVVLNGVTYPNGVNTIYLPGNYVAFGVPPSGYRFNSWAMTGTSTLSSTSLQNATLVLKSNGTLTANFIPGATTTTVTFLTTSSITTSTSTSTTSTSTTTTTTSTSTSTTSTSTTSTSTSTSSTSTTITQTLNPSSGNYAGDVIYSSSTSLGGSVTASNMLLIQSGVVVTESTGQYLEGNVMFDNAGGTVTVNPSGGSGGAGGTGGPQGNQCWGTGATCAQNGGYAGSAGSGGSSITSSYLSVSLSTGAGGAGGGGGGAGTPCVGGGNGGNGGTGGTGGGILQIYAGNFVNTGSITATGGTGVAGVQYSFCCGGSPGSCGGGGGGGLGGAGGTVFIGYATMVTLGSVAASGGSGGAGAPPQAPCGANFLGAYGATGGGGGGGGAYGSGSTCENGGNGGASGAGNAGGTCGQVISCSSNISSPTVGTSGSSPSGTVTERSGWHP